MQAAALQAPAEESVTWDRDAAWHTGLLYVMDAASMLPVVALAEAFEGGRAPEGARVLDIAAAPGGKAAALAAWVAPAGGLLVANEPSEQRSRVLYENLMRVGAMPWTAISKLPGQRMGMFWPGEFDAVLLDAPCSGESATRKGASIAERWDQIDAVRKQAYRQKKMITSAFEALKVGGVLVYSTCTLNPLENEEVLEHLENRFGAAVERLPLEGVPGVEASMLTKEGYVRIFPQVLDCASFFVARVRKISSATAAADEEEDLASESEEAWTSPRRNALPQHFSAMRGKEKKSFERQLQQRFGHCPSKDEAGLVLMRRGPEIWLCPKALQPLRLVGISTSGIHLADAKGKHIPNELTNEWFLSFGHAVPPDVAGCAVLSDPEAARSFCAGQDVEVEAGAEKRRNKDQVVVKYGDFVLGTARWAKGGRVLRNDVQRRWRCPDIVF